MALYGTAVIGAGSLGLFTALWLARRGERVVVFDKAAPMREASGVNAGSLGIQNKLLPLVPLTLTSLERWADAQSMVGADVGYHRVGGFRIATTDSEVETLRRGFEAQQRVGVRLQWLDGDEARERAPYLSDDVHAATYCAEDSVADPLRFGPALLNAAKAAGVEVRSGCSVRSISAGKNGFAVGTGSDSVHSRRVLVAAGAWSQPLCAQLDLNVPIALDVNIVSVTEPRPPAMHEVVTHVRGILTLKQVANGTFLIGGGWQGKGDLRSGQKDVIYETSLHNIRLAARTVPALKQALLVRQWAGFEGVSPDSLPYAGAIPGTNGAYVLACSRGGWTIAPELGRAMSELMLDGRTDIDMDRFRPERHAYA